VAVSSLERIPHGDESDSLKAIDFSERTEP